MNIAPLFKQRKLGIRAQSGYITCTTTVPDYQIDILVAKMSVKYPFDWGCIATTYTVSKLTNINAALLFTSATNSACFVLVFAFHYTIQRLCCKTK